MITPIKLAYSNAFLIQGERPLLVDTGSANETDKIVAALAAQDVSVADLSLIVHTHIHGDHVGSTNDLLQQADIPVAYHPADLPLARQGHNGALQGTSWRGRLWARVFKHGEFDSPPLNVELVDGMRLEPYGVEGRIVHTPGHTPGSVSVVLDSGEAIVGDVLMGGYMGGALLPHRPNLHYFAEDIDQVRASIERLLRTDVHTFYVGHGGPLAADRVRGRQQEL